MFEELHKYLGEVNVCTLRELGKSIELYDEKLAQNGGGLWLYGVGRTGLWDLCASATGVGDKIAREAK